MKLLHTSAVLALMVSASQGQKLQSETLNDEEYDEIHALAMADADEDASRLVEALENGDVEFDEEFWGKVGGFLKKAAGTVGKVVSTVAPMLGPVGSIVGGIAGAGLQAIGGEGGGGGGGGSAPAAAPAAAPAVASGGGYGGGGGCGQPIVVQSASPQVIKVPAGRREPETRTIRHIHEHTHHRAFPTVIHVVHGYKGE